MTILMVMTFFVFGFNTLQHGLPINMYVEMIINIIIMKLKLIKWIIVIHPTWCNKFITCICVASCISNLVEIAINISAH